MIPLAGDLRVAEQNAVEVGYVEAQEPFVLEIEVQHVVPGLPMREKGLHFLVEQIGLAGAANADQYAAGKRADRSFSREDFFRRHEFPIVKHHLDERF